MPRSVSSAVIHFLKRRNYKHACVFITLSVIVIGNWYLYEGRQVYPTPSQRCSNSYPEYSVVLDLHVTLPDGSYQNSDGTTYPAWSIWESDGVVRGCPCSIMSCVQRCCHESKKLGVLNTTEYLITSENYTDNNNTTMETEIVLDYKDNSLYSLAEDYNDYGFNLNETDNVTDEFDDLIEDLQQYTCTDADMDDTFVHWFRVFSTKGKSKTFNFSKNLFSNFDPQCDSIAKINSSIITVFDDGSIWDRNVNGYLDISEICFHPFNTSFIEPYSCSHYPPFKKTAEETDEFIKTVWSNSFIVMAMLVHVVTLVVFVLVPHLRTGYGKPVMCYVLSQLLRKGGIILFQAIGPIEVLGLEIQSVFLGIEYFGALASQCWQVVIAHKMWTAFSFKAGSLARSATRSTRTFSYSDLTWTIPLVCMLLSGLWVEDLHILGISNIGYHMRELGAFIPGLTAEAICLTLCAGTAYRLRAWHQGANKLRGPDSRRHNAKDVHWSTILLKVTMITGVDYILVTVVLVTRQGYFWPHTTFNISPILFSIPDDINNLRGVEMFFIFVVKPDVWKSLQNRFKSISRSTTVTRGNTARTTRSSRT